MFQSGAEALDQMTKIAPDIILLISRCRSWMACIREAVNARSEQKYRCGVTGQKGKTTALNFIEGR